MKLHKTTIIIWSEFNPGSLELSELAREAEDGMAYCSEMTSCEVANPEEDPSWDGTEFFKSGIEETA